MEKMIFYLPIICKKEDIISDEDDDSCDDPILLAKAEKCIGIAKNFDIDPDSDDIIEECATSLMWCSVVMALKLAS